MKLNRIKEVNISDKCLVEDEKFDIFEYISRTWSMTPEGNIYDVKLRFLPKVAYSIVAVKWHSTQKVTFKSYSSAIIEFRIDGLIEIIWWILDMVIRFRLLCQESYSRELSK